MPKAGDRRRKQYLLCGEFVRETLYRQTAVSDVGMVLLFAVTKRTIAIF
jgi:hypothetical protein